MAAYLQWNINSKMHIRMGKQFVALGREDWMYPCDLASMEFSATDFTYAIWSSFATQFHHVVSDKFRYWAAVGNGVYGARTYFPSDEANDLALSGRVEYQPLGNWDLWGNMTGRPGKKFGILIGLGGGHNLKFKDDQGDEIGDRKNGTQLNLDVSIIGNRYQFFTQYVNTSRNYVGDSEARYGMASYTTFGYWATPKLFPYIKFDFVGKGNYAGVSEDYASPGVGLSLYPFHWTNKYKITLEYNYLKATLNNTYVVPDGQLGLVSSSYGGKQSIRLQLQFGF